MKNTLKKITLLSVIAMISFTQIGCGVYYDPFYDDGWNVEEEIEIIEPVGYYSTEKLTFEIRWEDPTFDPDLETSLITPFNAYVVDGGPELDGCYFLGTYDDSFNEKVSMIECIAPIHGTYELEIENVGFTTRYPSIRVVKQYDNGHGIHQQTSTQDVSVLAGDSVLLHYSF